MKIETNNHSRFLLDWSDLNEKEKAEFDYIEYPEQDGSARFFRFKGVVYDINEFQTTTGLPHDNPLREWDGYANDSFFSGIVVRYCGVETVVVGTFYA